MTPGGFRERPYKVHADPIEGDAYDGKRKEGYWWGLPWSGAFALRALLTEASNLCIHSRPDKVVLQFLQCVLCPPSGWVWHPSWAM